jgi:hypothetical protein
MADFTQNPQGGFASHQHPEYAVTPAGSISKLTNLTGAVISLALVVGVGIWGYKLLVRDVSGIPVVRAIAGDMRVRPEEPGGDFALHQGLSVNSVAAVGTAQGGAEELRLAPRPIDLAEEDQPIPDMAELAASQSAQPEAAPDVAEVMDVAAALENGSVEDLVAQLTAGVIPMEQTGDETVPVLASVAIADMDAEDLPEMDNAGGLQVSLRPSLRPQGVARASAVTPVAATANTTSEVDAATLPVGTRLVQLGAFDTPEIARAQWSKLDARFAPFMEGKQRIVMEAKSGGRTFYRLRAHGFEDIGDARRFCSALVAESVDCIPVVTR